MDNTLNLIPTWKHTLAIVVDRNRNIGIMEFYFPRNFDAL